MVYEYKMVQIPPTIQVQAKGAQGNEAAIYIQSIANELSVQGWEFYRVDTVGVISKPGCLAGIFGQKESLIHYFVMTFRKPR